jgi:hypothetical protein
MNDNIYRWTVQYAFLSKADENIQTEKLIFTCLILSKADENIQTEKLIFTCLILSKADENI